MFGIVAFHIFDYKVINNKTKRKMASVMFPLAWSDWDGVIAVQCKSFLQLFVGNNGCLREAIHASSDFGIHKVVGDKLLELI
jgi:hypothetical protein